LLRWESCSPWPRSYPDLKANQNFLALQAELSNTEDRIQAARRFYNANVADYNRRVQAFPSSFIAHQFNFKEEEFFEIPESERAVVGAAPQVSFSGGGTAPAPMAPPPAPEPGTPGLPPPRRRTGERRRLSFGPPRYSIGGAFGVLVFDALRERRMFAVANVQMTE